MEALRSTSMAILCVLRASVVILINEHANIDRILRNM